MPVIGRVARSSRISVKRSSTAAAEPSCDPAGAEPSSTAKPQIKPCDTIFGTHRILDVLQARWEASLLALRTQEEERLIALLPHMAETINQLKAIQQAAADQGAKFRAHLTPKHA